ncbi:Uncharacterized protein TCM_025420 [Theobroma cacao]|uniref:RNase H type-1 domain-containing protein n=1 Tax=Theobroma cacao TaxID=3641 RepID=A0A061F023_THECC|nr:Uncharacterized protein TCM_025420 [Theobroma cacao]
MGGGCTYKDMGGLGMVELGLKNRAILNKWLWRFEMSRKNLVLGMGTSGYGIELRCAIFGWETEQWSKFFMVIKDQVLEREFDDKLICKGKSWDEDMIFELVKVRIAWWTKAKWLNLNILVKDLMRFLNQGENHSFSAIARRQVACSRPNDGWIKFNIDSASRGNPRESSIGGILRDSRGTILDIFSKQGGKREPGPVAIGDVLTDDEEAIKIMFTKPMGVNEVNMTKVLAI